jgi:hypothetical protein
MHRVDGPELVGAIELDRWAATEDAKGAFPDLMSRMLAATLGVTNIDVRSHEGVSAPGWDGAATSTGSSFLPIGELRFEFGTDQRPRTKAQADYDKRVKALPADAEAIFVFATPRNWATGKAWAKEREAEKKFQGVKVIDAHTLADWLRSAPAVHYWISERLGYRPRDAKTIERWRSEFDDRITLTMPASFFLAGRSTEAERLVNLLTTAGQGAVTIRAPWRQEALAFIHAVAAGNNDLLRRIVIVQDAASWARLARSETQLILVPCFDAPDVRDAEDNGHRVVLVGGVDERITKVDIDLPKIDPHTAGDALRKTNPDIHDEHGVVSLARRSLPALVRSRARDPRFREPVWVKDKTQSDVLSRLLVAGVWTPRAADQDVIAELTCQAADDVERLLQHLWTSGDAPFVRSGEIWRLASPVEAGMLLFPKLTTRDMNAWNDAVLKVLLEPDPHRGIDTLTRLTASAKGEPQQYSGTLREGFAKGLALAASLDVSFPSGRSGQEWVDRIVYALLATAQEDRTGVTWERLTDVLPSLAEAAPEVFLDAVESDLSGEDSLLKGLFRDAESDVFGSSSPHTGLLWALEALCWEPTLFPRAARALAMLAAIDPGGRLSNRPIESLKNITLGWIRHSGATVDDKIELIDELLGSASDVGWKVLLAVWPSNHSIAVPPHRTTYKDWMPSSTIVSLAEWSRFLDGLTDLALRHSGSHATLWREIVEHAHSLPFPLRSRLMQSLAAITQTQTWTAEERFSVWNALQSEIDSHAEFSDADWAVPTEELETWRTIAAAVEPDTDPRRYVNLFDWRTRIGQLKHGDEGFEQELYRRQREAVEEVSIQGIDALRTLTIDVKIPWRIGTLVAETGDTSFDRAILSWLDTDEQNLRQAALALASNRIGQHGLNWLRAALAWPEIKNDASKADLMSAVPATHEYWSQIPNLGREFETAYWNRVNPYSVRLEEYQEAVQRLIGHGLAWSAINVLANALDQNTDPSVGLIKAAFGAIGSSAGPSADRTMTSYYIQNLLTYMEKVATDDPDLPSLEFLFFDFLHDHQPSGALYRALANSPSEFVELVKLVFRAEGEEKRQLSAEGSSRARIAFSVLREWPTVPGQRPDGSIDAEHLSEWVRAARLALADSNRTSIGDEVIGEILSASPEGSDKIWPAEPVRELIETIGSARLDTGIHIGLHNRRGVTWRGVFDGGKQERELEAKYRDMSIRATKQWRRTSRVLRGIADSYREEARRNDVEAEQLADEG